MQPIGYWLKEVDRLIEESFERLLTGEDLSRRHWQVLNTLATGPVPAEEVDAALAPFQPTVAPEVDELVVRGWVRRDGDAVELTNEGITAHAAMSERVMAHRRAVIDGISTDEYAAMVGLLERMANNLRNVRTGT
jgi:DNA-binding MarR family transcriptional regulator